MSENQRTRYNTSLDYVKPTMSLASNTEPFSNHRYSK